MNATGFRKILKKWDKRSKSSTKELYLARQVDVQPCFNREVISELSDTAAANVRKLEGLCIAKGGETTVDPAADGILSERKAEMAVANAQAQGDLLSNLENELMSAAKTQDLDALQNILSTVPSCDTLEGEMKSQMARIFWRAAISEPIAIPPLLDSDRLEFGYVDDINGRTPLIEAAARGKRELARLCVEKGVSVRHRDIYGREALHYAAGVDAELCALLLEHGADRSPVDFDGYSPLIHAITAGNLTCVEVLVGSGPSSSSSQHESVLPLALASKQGNLPIIAFLLLHGYSISPDASGYLPQHIAAREGHVEALDILLQAGAAIDAPDKFANWTPLFHAANEGHLACVQALLRAGASVTVVDDQGKTPTHHAAWSGHPEIVSALLLASPKSKSKAKLSPSNGPRKRDAAQMNDDMDLDGDLIPDLSLPPPAIPLRTYGHTYLENKRSLVQLTLGHPTTSTANTPCIRFYRHDQLSSIKLVITSQRDRLHVPHTIMLPQADEREIIPLFVDSIDDFTLQVEVYPVFGSRLIGKVVCLPSTFAKLRSIDAFTAPIIDSHMNVIGEFSFELNRISHFESVQLAIGGRLETYWKSTTTEPAVKPTSWKNTGASELAFITASSLSRDYTKIVVQVTRDGVPFAYPRWLLPTDVCDFFIMDVTADQLSKLADRTGRSLASKRDTSMETVGTYAFLSEVIAPLQEILLVRSGSSHKFK